MPDPANPTPQRPRPGHPRPLPAPLSGYTPFRPTGPLGLGGPAHGSHYGDPLLNTEFDNEKPHTDGDSTSDETMQTQNGGQPIIIESGGVRVKLPTFVLIQILTMLGALGAGHALNKPDIDSAKQSQNDVAVMRAEFEKLKVGHIAFSERLARIEANTENIRDELRENRRMTRARGYRE